MLQKEDARRIEWILLASFSGVFFSICPLRSKRKRRPGAREPRA
jgi:hypothetical protein